MEFRMMVTITLYTRQQKSHWCIEQSFGLCGRGRGWDDLGEWHWNMYNIIYEMSRQFRFDARYWMLGAGALGRPRGMVWGGRREEGSGWGIRVYLWRIQVDIWQNQYNIVKLNNKIKLKKKKKLTFSQSFSASIEVIICFLFYNSFMWWFTLVDLYPICFPWESSLHSLKIYHFPSPLKCMLCSLHVFV